MAQFTLYSHKGGPNGWKVAFILEELGLTYDTKFLNFQAGEQKAPEFTQYNPNGRIPAIIDHGNDDFVLWESAAIIEYIVDKYDKEGKISYKTGGEYYKQKQWLAFQISGQGPYFGQAAWFQNYHPEKLPSAIERYQKETERVVGVLDGVLAKQKYLVSDEKVTYADIAFISWNLAVTRIKPDIDLETKYPNYLRWHTEITSRPAVAKVLEERAAANKH